MDRRRFLLTSVAGTLGWPLGGEAQQTAKPARVGRLSALSADADAPFMTAFRQGIARPSAQSGSDLNLTPV